MTAPGLWPFDVGGFDLPVMSRRPAALGPATIAVALIVACLAFVHVADPDGDTRLLRALQNAAHVPAFGVIAVLALFALRVAGVRRTQAYLGALLLTLALGGASEWVQIHSPNRNASVGDWLRDAAGAVAFLCLAAIWRRDVARPPAVFALLLVAVLCLSVVATPIALLWRDYLGRDAAFPVICCNSGEWEDRFIRTNAVELAPIAPAAYTEGDGFLRMDFSPAKWPGITIKEIFPDWSGHHTLAFDIYSEDPVPTRFVLRVDDRGHDGVTFHDRFNRSLAIEAGLNRFRIPIADILEAPTGRRMDVRRMKKLVLFANSPKTPFTVYWNGFWLIPDQVGADL